MDANNKKEEISMDDMEKQRNKMSDDLEKNKEEEAEKDERRDINGSPQSGLEKEPFHKKPPLQDKTVEDTSLGNSDTSERNNEESTNSVHGLDSIVPDSQSPLEEECFESVNNSRQSQNTGAQEGDAVAAM
ncbi:hypothetical protein RHGRI_022459 [Rhododendron griersonianum]|uniref:Uncharacterized protein n=1 Tax=Rhododendron griersonianum TaxID=479676 RepID=A0AAV6J6J9_9ERIC|nr:hypothetical protein RHGRI_022459 [Rhododendron griersonianum]